ncbi:MAG: hypothetical protein NTV01_20655 [Bacteroidia bacterium]|nr:hypothetical protein [Bacteroidia bacterium]
MNTTYFRTLVGVKHSTTEMGLIGLILTFMTAEIFKRVRFLIEITLCSFTAFKILHAFDDSYIITPFNDWDTYFGDGIWYHSNSFWIGVLVTILIYFIIYGLLIRVIRRRIKNRIKNIHNQLGSLTIDVDKQISRLCNLIIKIGEFEKHDTLQNQQILSAKTLTIEIVIVIHSMLLCLLFGVFNWILIIGFLISLMVIIIQYLTIPMLELASGIFLRVFNEKVSQKV